MAAHLNTLSLTAREPSPDAADEIERIFAEHEAECTELARREARNGLEEDRTRRVP